jgi:hypothetical protein
MFRHEEDSNHVDLIGNFTDETLQTFERVFGGRSKLPAAVLACPGVPMSVHISVSRFGEVLFRISFDGVVEYDAMRDKWVKGICQCYVDFFYMIFDGVYVC